MNYALHYKRLMERGNSRTLTGYVERHHVLPRCMGGANASDNIVALTPEEHYVAHQLLVKMHPSVRGLAHAAVKMAKQCTGNKAYGWLRRRHVEALKGRCPNVGHRHSALVREQIAAAGRGRIVTEETKRLMSLIQKGRVFSEATRQRMSAAAKARGISQSSLVNLAMSRGKPLSAKHRQKIAAAMTDKKLSAESRGKISASRRRLAA